MWLLSSRLHLPEKGCIFRLINNSKVAGFLLEMLFQGRVASDEILKFEVNHFDLLFFSFIVLKYFIS